MSDWFDDAFEEDCALFHEADLRMERKAAEERAQRAEARVRDLEDAQGELLETLSRSVLVSERPDYCRVCDRYFP